METNVRLLIADIDGTLVTQEKVLTRRSMEAVDRLRDRGHCLHRHQRPAAPWNQNDD
jgi:hydroxymethylpyrimidine pyrophosphatase-like HAD family hydrolase